MLNLSNTSRRTDGSSSLTKSRHPKSFVLMALIALIALILALIPGIAYGGLFAGESEIDTAADDEAPISVIEDSCELVYYQGTLTIKPTASTGYLPFNELKSGSISSNDKRYTNDTIAGLFPSKVADITTIRVEGTVVFRGYAVNFFEGLTNLVSITVAPGASFTSSNLHDIEGLFRNCSSLTDISALANWDTSGVTDMSEAFHGCTSLIGRKLEPIRYWNTARVTDMSGMFFGCTALDNLNHLAHSGDVWNTGSVTNFGSMFRGCTQLKNITALGAWDVSSAESLGYMFTGCPAISTIAPLGSWQISSAIHIESLFKDCIGISDISPLAAWKDYCSNIRYTHDMFNGCWRISNFSALEEWTVPNIIQMNEMFMGCEEMTAVPNLSSWSSNALLHIDKMFKDCTKLKDLSGLAGFRVPYVVYVGSLFEGCTALSDLTPLSNWNLDGTSAVDLSSMFKGCKKLTSLSGLESFKSIKRVGKLNSTFQDCSLLVDIEALAAWPNYQTKGDISGIFQGCTALEDVSALLNWDTYGVPKQNAFTGCPITRVGFGGSWGPTSDMGLGSPSSIDPYYTGNWMLDSSSKNLVVTTGALCGGFNADTMAGIWRAQTMDDLLATDLALATIEIPAQAYTGKAVTPSPAVVLDGVELIFGSDYSITYQNNVNLGTATATFTGRGTYSGIQTVEFEIELLASAGDVAVRVTADEPTTLKMMPASGTTANMPSTATSLKNFFTGSLKAADVDTIAVTGTINLGADSTGLFRDFTHLESFAFAPGASIKTANVEKFDYAFANCLGLSDVSQLSGWSTAKVASTNGMFSGCTNLANISGISGWMSGTSLRTVDSMFEGCKALSDISPLRNWKTSEVTSMNRLFYGCTALNDFTALRQWNTKKVASMNSMLTNCPITRIALGTNWNTATNMGLWSPSGKPINTSSISTMAAVGEYAGLWADSEDPNKDYYTSSTLMSPTLDANVRDGLWVAQTMEQFNQDTIIFDGIDDATWTGAAITQPSLEVSFGSEPLKQDRDFTVRYSNNVAAGTATITVTGANKYLGTASTQFIIERASITDATVGPTPIQDLVYNGKAQTPAITVSYNGKNLVSGTDYRIVNADDGNRTECGPASVKLEGLGNLTDSRIVDFAITQRSIADAAIAVAAQAYTGEALTPSPRVTVGGMTLVEGRDFDVEYADNIDHGTAKVTVTAKGNFTGTKTGTFRIADAHVVSSKPVHRVYFPRTGEHLFTIDNNEQAILLMHGWVYEGVGWMSPTLSSKPVFRLYNPGDTFHHFTSSVIERDHLVSHGWVYEGIACYSDEMRGVPIWRGYSSWRGSGHHHFTTDHNEFGRMRNVGWIPENIGWYGVLIP